MTKRASPVRSRRRLIVGALIVVLLTPACGVFKVVRKEGQRVGIDPCSLIEKADAEQILEAPVIDPAFTTERSGVYEVLSCSFEKRDGPDVGEGVSIFTYAVTQAQLGHSSSPSPSTAPSAAARDISIGKEAKASWGVSSAGPGGPATPVNTLVLIVLSEEGVLFWVQIIDARREGEAMLGDAEALAKSALKTIKKKFPGTYKPPALTIDPANPCPLLSLQEVEELVRKYSEGLKVTPIEVFGGRFGGYRGCAYQNNNPRPYTPLQLLLSKGSATIDEVKRIQGGETIKSLGAYAYWIPGEQRYWNDTLLVLTVNSKVLRLGLEGPSDLRPPADQRRALAVEVAKKVLPRIK